MTTPSSPPPYNPGTPPPYNPNTGPAAPNEPDMSVFEGIPGLGEQTPASPQTLKLGTAAIKGLVPMGGIIVDSVREGVVTGGEVTANSANRLMNGVNAVRRTVKGHRLEAKRDKLELLGGIIRNADGGVEDAWGDATVSVSAAQLQKKIMEPSKPWNPIEKWDTHVTTRPPHAKASVSRGTKSPKHPLTQDPDQNRVRTAMQERSVRKAGTIARKIKAHKRDEHEPIFLHGHIIDSEHRDEFKQMLRTGRFTSGEKKHLKNASRTVRMHERKIHKYEKKLDKMAEGRTIGTRVIGARIKHIERVVGKYEAAIPKLERTSATRKGVRTERVANRTKRRQMHYGERRSAQIDRVHSRAAEAQAAYGAMLAARINQDLAKTPAGRNSLRTQYNIDDDAESTT